MRLGILDRWEKKENGFVINLDFFFFPRNLERKMVLLL